MLRMLSAIFMFGLSSFAYAAEQSQGPGMIGNVVMIAGFLLIFYFMLIRPQTKRAKEHQSLIASIAKEDEVITAGGILGKVIKVSEQFVIISISEGTEIVVQKQAISGVLPKGTLKAI